MILDLFAGAGGAGIGLRRVFPDELIVHVDHDADCCATLRAVVGDGKLRPRSDGTPSRDMVIPLDVGSADLLNLIRPGPGVRCDGLWASPPCRPYSHAGKRLGADDPRDAWPATLAVIEATRPQWVVIENVRGSPAETWRSAIDRLGYTTELWELDAADFGVPQHRRRRFVVARQGVAAFRPPERTHQRPDALNFTGRKPWVTGWTFHGGPDRASDGAFLATGRRRLTVEECAVLQGWPAGWPFQGTKASRYRQVGNGCPPALTEAVVRALIRRP